MVCAKGLIHNYFMDTNLIIIHMDTNCSLQQNILLLSSNVMFQSKTIIFRQFSMES